MNPDKLDANGKGNEEAFPLMEDKQVHFVKSVVITFRRVSWKRFSSESRERLVDSGETGNTCCITTQCLSPSWPLWKCLLNVAYASNRGYCLH